MLQVDLKDAGPHTQRSATYTPLRVTSLHTRGWQKEEQEYSGFAQVQISVI